MRGEYMEQIIEEYGITVCLFLVGFVILEALELVYRML